MLIKKTLWQADWSKMRCEIASTLSGRVLSPQLLIRLCPSHEDISSILGATIKRQTLLSVRFSVQRTWWTKLPPSSRQRRRSSVSHAPGSYIQPAWCPCHRSAEPGTESQCSAMPASRSGSCSVCRKGALGLSCAMRQRRRWEIASAGAPGCWQWPAGRVDPRGGTDLQD